MPPYSVLIVDDDDKIVQLLKAYFEKNNFLVHTNSNGLDAVKSVQEKHIDIMILDLMLPGLDGWEVCKKIRQQSDLPILMLTARDEESDRLIGLELGADDYVTKPFSPKEVVARAKAILRRTYRETGTQEQWIQSGPLKIDLARHLALNNEYPLELTPTEFKLLEILVQNPGKVFSRLQLIEQIQDFAYEGYERTVDAHIKNLRHKLEEDSKKPKYIVTVYGIGYKFAGE
jgi:DNA-binding response OmpR family regulator